MHSLVQSGKLALPDPDDTADMEDAGIAFLAESGYERYEISNFCLSGHACRHNLNYWRNGTYLGLGVSAHGCLGSGRERVRYKNLSDPAGYASTVRRGKLPVDGERPIPFEEQMFESVMLGLRTSEGVDEALFAERFGITPSERYPEAVAALSTNGWLRPYAGHLALNDRGLDMNNAAIRLFMP